jgi:hypothetical protein
MEATRRRCSFCWGVFTCLIPSAQIQSRSHTVTFAAMASALRRHTSRVLVARLMAPPRPVHFRIKALMLMSFSPVLKMRVFGPLNRSA